MLRNIFFINVFTLFFFISEAQTCCSGGIPLSNNIGLNILDKGMLQTNLSYDYNYLNTLNSGSNKLDDDARLRTTSSLLLNFGYSITDNLAIEGLFTWVKQKRVITQFGNVNEDNSTGIGDGVVLVKYNFDAILGRNSSVGFGLGAKVPLGSTTEKSDRGIVLNADMQPGSGAWDVIYWSQISKSFDFRPSLNFSIRAIYRGTGVNGNYLNLTTYEFGNEFQSFLSFIDQFELFNLNFSPSIAVKYRKAKKDIIGGFDLDNTGGEWVFLIPNLSVDISSKLSISSKVELPIYSYVDGTQLTPTYRITMGMLYKISLKKKRIKTNI